MKTNEINRDFTGYSCDDKLGNGLTIQPLDLQFHVIMNGNRPQGFYHVHRGVCVIIRGCVLPEKEVEKLLHKQCTPGVKPEIIWAEVSREKFEDSLKYPDSQWSNHGLINITIAPEKFPVIN